MTKEVAKVSTKFITLKRPVIVDKEVEVIQIVEIPEETIRYLIEIVEVPTVVVKKIPFEYTTEVIEYVDREEIVEYTSDRVKEFTTTNVTNKVIKRKVEV